MKNIAFEIEYPGIEFLDIQKKIITEDKEVTGIFLGTGVGKTLTALCMAEGDTLVVCPKQQKLDRTWEKNNEKFDLGKTITVMSKEEFRRDWDLVPAFDTVIFDEGHNMCGVLPDTKQVNHVLVPKTSQIFEASLKYLKKNPPKRFYICTATPASKPMNAWAIARLQGKDWDFFKFREVFYFPRKMGYRTIWMAKTDQATRNRLAAAVQKLGYTGSLSDFMDVPDQTHLEVYVSLSGEQKKALARLEIEEADPLVRRARMRTIENGILYTKKVESIANGENKIIDRLNHATEYFENGKLDYIMDYAEEFPKMIIFAAYTAQVHNIAYHLNNEKHPVRTVTGDTHPAERATIFDEAEKAEKMILVVQAGICEGYRVPSAPCVIFASKSNRYVHYEQGKGRILDSQHLKKNLYVHLITKDGADEACHQAIMAGEDFQEKLSIASA